MANSIKQTAPVGFLLTNGEVYSYEVYLPLGVELWEVVFNEGQLDDPREPDDTVVPPIIKQGQGKLQLAGLGLYEMVEAMISQAGIEEKIYWSDWDTWRRDSPIINRLAPMIWEEDTDAQLDMFFIEATKIV
jgi:hypothetical protein